MILPQTVNLLYWQRVLSVVGESTVRNTVGALSTLRVTSFPVVRRAKTPAGRAATVTSTSTSAWNVPTSAATTPTVSTSTAPTRADAMSGTNAEETNANVSRIFVSK